MYCNIKQQIEDLLIDYPIPKALHKGLMKIADRAQQESKGCISWCADDIIERAREHKKWYLIPAKKEAQIILEIMIDNHDAGIGISWDTIDTHLTNRKTRVKPLLLQ